MGTGFTSDTPLRVARYGISSVISLVDDQLLEELRRVYSAQYNKEYRPIRKYDDDWRACRITAYLDLIDEIVRQQFDDLKGSSFSPGTEITRYFELLSDRSPLRVIYDRMLTSGGEVRQRFEDELRESILPGSINVNIMTKLDRTNFDKSGEPMAEIYSDALAALRGYAQSRLGSTTQSSIVFSAGLNRRLYSYSTEFDDFFMDRTGRVKKEIILKVSDYRSAVVQGKFFAKKGLWVSEYRIESGLNCGGHAFAGNGFLIGPVLAELKARREHLTAELTQICSEALKQQNRPVPDAWPAFRVTAQGGIGTSQEDVFIRRNYGLDSTGWGSPFLLVPEVTPVEPHLLDKLARAREDDLYLSDVSPVGVPFYTLKDSPSEEHKRQLIDDGKPGSPCPLGHLVSNTEFTEQPLCTASRQYQTLKIAELKRLDLSESEYQLRFKRITAKACICNELGDTVYALRGIPKKDAGVFPAVCPGPNIAYFDRVASLREMVDHIYGRMSLMNHPDRPHMFIKELMLNIDFLDQMVQDRRTGTGDKKDSDFEEFHTNLSLGIDYYQALIPLIQEETAAAKARMLDQLDQCRQRLAGVEANTHSMPALVREAKALPRKKDIDMPTAVAVGDVVPNGVELTLLVASHSGNGKSFARKAEVYAQRLGFKVKRCDMAAYDLHDLPEEKVILAIISTYGEGEAPAAAEDLFEYLYSRQPPDLSGVSFSVLALGDRSYVHFCSAGRDLDVQLEKLGGHRIFKRVDCDVDLSESAGLWLKGALGTLLPANAAGLKEDFFAVLPAADGVGSSGYSAKNPFPAVILSKQDLHKGHSLKETYHIQFEIKGSGITYLPGDSCGVVSQNSPQLVDELLSQLQLSALTTMSDGGSLAEFLKGMELTVLIPPVLESHNRFAQSRMLSEILADSLRLKEFLRGRDFIDILMHFPVQYRADDLREVLRPIPPRLYSIASSQSADPDHLEILVKAVRYRTAGRDKEGLASTFLTDRVQTGEKVPIFIRPNENFRLPVDRSAPVIMVSAGTGVAPFRAFVQERAAQGHSGRNWLFFGNPYAATDFLYQEEWEAYLKNGILSRLSTAFSRDQARKVYVTHRIQEQAKDIYAWLEQGAYIYVSGAAKLADDTADTVALCIEHGGGLSHDKASEFVKRLKHSGRYLQDVY
jgi:NADPH-dependent sulfite reductase flavoprotein alpha-component